MGLSDRWLIYKDGQALGPFTPEEIRQSLREGSFDPFDLVSREGSSVRRELVEVDELFFTSKVVYAGDQASGQAMSSGPSAFAASGNLPAVREMTQASQQGAPDIAGNGHLALASAARATLHSQTPNRPAAQQQQQNRARKRRRDPKHFHVMDPRGRVLGPIGAGEIQALFYKGVLDKDVKVMRDGSRAQVPVARFVAIYSEANRVKRAMQQGAHPIVQGGISRANSLPAPRVAMGSPGSSVSPIAVIAIIAALLFGGIAAYMFMRNAGTWSAKDRPTATKQQKQKLKKRKVRPLPEEAPAPQETAPRLSKAQKKKAERLAELKRQRAKLLEIQERRGNRRNKNVRTVAVPAPKTTPKPAPKPFPQAAPVVKQPSQKPVVASSPAPAAQSPAQPLPKAAEPVPAKPQGQTVASLTDGQQVTNLGPMSFDKSALGDCEGSCSLTFSGAGGSVKGAFFKGVWGPALEGKSGSVYISGLVKKNGDSVKIIVSNVK